MKEYCILLLYSEELERDVKIYISLPNNYYESDQCYPVLYIHDGQIAFNDYEEYMGTSWGIMEKFKRDPNSTEIILVGIASGDTRNDELIPFSITSPKTGKSFGGKSKDYMDFIVNKLKPIINNKYRTITSSEKTGLLGISLGGVCTTYAAAEYSEHFKIFGCISSSYKPVHEKILKLLKESDLSQIEKMYLDIGTNESEVEQRRIAFLDTNKEVFEVLQEKINSDKLKVKIIEGSQHIEEDWNKRIPDIISYLFES